MLARIAAEIEAQRAMLGTRAGRLVAGALAGLAVLTVVAMAVLWPGDRPMLPGGGLVISRGIVPAEVTGVMAMTCPVETRPGCARVNLRLLGGPDEGKASSLVLPGDEAAPRLSPGDRIRVAPSQGFGDVPLEPTAADPTQAPYGFVDFERRTPLVWLGLSFFAVVAILGRRVGVLSLLAVVVGLVLVTVFVIPAILSGKSPFAVALVGSFAAMFATVVLVYGISAKSLAALLGTAASLLLIAILATVFTGVAHITGRASEDAALLQSLGQGRISLGGLVLAGILIAALGVLNDVTISQASTVLALRRADPRQRFAELYRAGAQVGRDHLGATVNTLVFAYAGASLPLLLIFSSQGIGFSDAINREVVASELVATLVGSIGLAAAVPLTTATAALLATRLPTVLLPEHDHAHHH
ncbi:MAG: YibE/F family protein [Solirubrobacteraceae bacterium]